jgi:hypothetical protein
MARFGSSLPTADNQQPTRQRRPWLWIAGAATALVIATMFVLASAGPTLSELLRRKLVTSLADRFESEVQIAEVQVRVFPRLHADVRGLELRHKRRHDVPPLISVRRLTIEAGPGFLLRKHVDEVRLEGLEIQIPPRDDDREPAGGASARQSGHDEEDRYAKDIVVDRLISSDARLVIIPRKTNKAPKVWEIHALQMQSVAIDRPMPFEATLTNAVPPGEIVTNGHFGPWRSGEPGATPVNGRFTFARADLSFFKGISGILSAHGEFGGTLGRLIVKGETDTPDFRVAVSGHPVPLHTVYQTTVDGTNGDTILDRIDGSFLKTSLVAKGSVVDTPGKVGRTVTLDIVMDKARLEDVLRLAVKAPKAPMTGALKLTTAFVLPPGKRDVVDKLRLDGQFSIARATFTDLDIQKKIDELSHRSRGKAVADDRERVASNFVGRFTLDDGMLMLKTLTFDTPGSSVQLAGTYGLQQEVMSFKGTLLMDATISQTQTGWKRILLKGVDPLFKKDGHGAVIPITIQGTRSNPSFGLDKGRVFKRDG